MCRSVRSPLDRCAFGVSVMARVHGRFTTGRDQRARRAHPGAALGGAQVRAFNGQVQMAGRLTSGFCGTGAP
jgi:hypothetical protein